MIFIIEKYQRYAAPLLGVRCRFYPSCSQYAIDAIQTHGAVQGVQKALCRILRCNPWNPGGYDPAVKRKCSDQID